MGLMAVLMLLPLPGMFFVVSRLDIPGGCREIVWEATSFRYRNIRVILKYSDFQNWRSILLV